MQVVSGVLGMQEYKPQKYISAIAVEGNTNSQLFKGRGAQGALGLQDQMIYVPTMWQLPTWMWGLAIWLIVKVCDTFLLDVGGDLI